MFKFEILPHTADSRIRVSGSDSEELFNAALKALAHLLKEDTAGKKEAEKSISLVSTDQTTLLVDFLNQVLTLSQINREIYTDAIFEELADKSVKAKIFGEKVQKFDKDIKAVTYHEAEIKKSPEGGLETNIVLDI
jgi:SHS2 domain-containing protein